MARRTARGVIEKMFVFRRSLRLCVFAVSTFLSLVAVAADDDGSGFKLQLSDWTYSRQRKTVTSSNRVTANVCVKNTAKEDLKDVTLTLRFTTAAGEKAAEPATKKIGDLKAGQILKSEVVA